MQLISDIKMTKSFLHDEMKKFSRKIMVTKNDLWSKMEDEV